MNIVALSGVRAKENDRPFHTRQLQDLPLALESDAPLHAPAPGYCSLDRELAEKDILKYQMM